METPPIETRVEDRATGAVVRLMAYRVLTREEAAFAVSTYLKQQGRKKFRKGESVTIPMLLR